MSGLADRDLNRVVDEKLVPNELIIQGKNGRRFSALSLAFAKFYFESARVLSATCRKDIINLAHGNVRTRRKHYRIPDEVVFGDKRWEIGIDIVNVDISPFVRKVWSNLRLADAAKSLITQDESVMSGRPVFKGTRLPVDMIVDCWGSELSIQEVQEAYPFLTEKQIDAAKVYVKLYPPRGRPRRLAEINPGLQRLSR